jgi:hypothetical protein
MIDFTNEQTITLAEAAALVPPSRGARTTNIATILRFILKGSKDPSGVRVRLEAARIGGKWVTSRQALQRFAEALTPRLADEDEPAVRTAGQRERATKAAGKKLEKLGM